MNLWSLCRLKRWKAKAILNMDKVRNRSMSKISRSCTKADVFTHLPPSRDSEKTWSMAGKSQKLSVKFRVLITDTRSIRTHHRCHRRHWQKCLEGTAFIPPFHSSWRVRPQSYAVGANNIWKGEVGAENHWFWETRGCWAEGWTMGCCFHHVRLWVSDASIHIIKCTSRLGTSKKAVGSAAAFEKIDREWVLGRVVIWPAAHMFNHCRYVVNAAHAARTNDSSHSQRVVYLSVGRMFVFGGYILLYRRL